jgi:hypothetical protein
MQVCDLGLTRWPTAIVRVMPLGGSSAPIEILSVDLYGYKNEIPRIAWDGPNKLNVGIHFTYNLAVFHRNIAGLHVNIELDPQRPEQWPLFEKRMREAEDK